VGRRTGSAALALALVATPMPAIAEGLFSAPPPPQGTLWFDVGADTTDALDARIELDVRASERALIRLGTGGSYIPTPSANVEAGYVLVGALVDTSPGTTVGGSYEFWGQEDTLTTHTVAGSLTLRGRAGSLSIMPQARRIVLYRQLVRTGARTEESTGRGLDLLGTLYGPGGWEWTFGAAAWNYTGSSSTLQIRTLDTRTLDTRTVDVQVAVVRVDSQVLLAPAAGFLERRVSAEAAYDFGAARLGAEGSATRYVTDANLTYGTALRLYLPIDAHQAMEIRAGRLFGGDFGPVTYGRLAIGYSW